MKKTLLVNKIDNVVTALENLSVGMEVDGIKILQDIQRGHKFAICDIKKGGFIIKYGEHIGAASVDIKKGQHVHVHNIEGIRGRGDL